MVYKINEATEVKYLLLDASGNPATGKTLNYKVRDELDAVFAGPTACSEIADGLYTMSFTPDAAGEWTVWFDCADPNVTDFVQIVVGKAIEQDTYNAVDTEIGTIITDVTRPAADSTANNEMAEVVGNKADTQTLTVSATASIIAYIKGLATNWTVTRAGYLDAAITGRQASWGAVAGTKTNIDTTVVDVTMPGADAAGATEMAEVIGNKADTVNQTIGTTSSIMRYVKAILTNISSTRGGYLDKLNITGNVANQGSVDGIVTDVALPGADAAGITEIGEVIGNKSDTANQTIGTTSSIMRYVKALLTNLTSARAGYLDKLNISGNVASQGSVDIIDPYFDVPGVDSAANTLERDVVGNKGDTQTMTVGSTQSLAAYIKGLVTNWTATRAGYLDAAISGRQASWGAIAGTKTNIDATVVDVTMPAADAATNNEMAEVVGNKADGADITINSTSSIMKYIKGLSVAVVLPAADLTTNVWFAQIIGNKSDTANTTINTTSSLMRYLKGVLTELQSATYGLSHLNTQADAVEGRLTSGRAGYLDRLQGHQMTRTFWSDVDDVIDISATAADVNLPDVVVPAITGTIVSVRAIVKIRMIENTSASGANAINVAQNIRIKKSTGTWGVDDIAAINLVDNQWAVAASTREGGDVQIGDNDIQSEVDAFNATYNLRFEDADVDYDYLRLNDVQVGLIFTWY